MARIEQDEKDLEIERLKAELERAKGEKTKHRALTIKPLSMTTKQIMADYKSLPADILDVEWISKFDHESEVRRVELMAESTSKKNADLLDLLRSLLEWGCGEWGDKKIRAALDGGEA